MPFDFAQGREPVERPFYDLQTNSGELEKRYPCPCSILKEGALEFDLLWSLCENSKLYGGKVRNQFVLDSNETITFLMVDIYGL